MPFNLFFFATSEISFTCFTINASVVKSPKEPGINVTPSRLMSFSRNENLLPLHFHCLQTQVSFRGTHI